ncbi:hypothetical protein HWV62_17384, partial [Athelia sp. TMB]
MDDPESSPPPRKRQRMSSPTYDEQVDLSQDDIAAFDQIEHKLSQSKSRSHSPQKLSLSAKEKRQRAIEEALRANHQPKGKENKHRRGLSSASPSKASAFSSQPRLDLDSENPFTGPDTNPPLASIYPSFRRATASIAVPQNFKSASNLEFDLPSSSQSQPRSPLPEAPPEQDYSAWFAPLQDTTLPPTANLFASASALPLFSSASGLHSGDGLDDAIGGLLPIIGFSKASRKGVLIPSAAALKEAEQKIREWQEGDPDPEAPILPAAPVSSHGRSRALSSGVADSPLTLNTPDTPSPAGMGFGRASLGGAITSFASPLQARSKVKPFSSPLLKKQAPSTQLPTFTSSPLNPARSSGSGFTPALAAHATQQPHPFASTPLNAFITPSLSSTTGTSGPGVILSTPMRPSLGVTPRAFGRSMPAKFVTPFKPGMRPGEAGRAALESPSKPPPPAKLLHAPTSASAFQSNPAKPVEAKDTTRWKAFNVSPPQERQTLFTCGLIPQTYDSDELEVMGINFTEISQITPVTALYYSFHTTSTTPTSQPVDLLGPTAALEQLLAKGCTLVTKPWVDNHWAMVLWKLAGMVCLDPERESDGHNKRWCWTSMTDDGVPIEPFPELEVTDGWYRLKARVDESLARAARRGVLKVGRKIAIARARLSSERKDPMEILEAYNSTHLVISGNSSHLAPWHAKLGFRNGPCISTLHHLNGDGGQVAAMAIVIIKAYPVAFIEFIENEDGTKTREGPRNENEENRVNEQWRQSRREIEASKLRAEHDKRMSVLEGYADRLERRAGPRFAPGEDDSEPGNIDDLYDELENSAQAAGVISRVSAYEAGWLARYIRERSVQSREAVGEEIEQELQKTFPSREVRNFRVLIVKDAYSNKRPSHRQAQLTVWDALGLSLSEGSKGGSFETGQRFM